MIYNTSGIEDSVLTLPIAQSARRIAQQFASEQPTPLKAEQVRLNTLAVCVVNDYLQQMMGIPTNLEASDCWNPVMRLCSDVADLEVTGVGCLECRPILKHESICQVPYEVWEDRIGLVVVEIDEEFRKASLLGFTPTVAVEELLVSELRALEDLIDRLHQSLQPLAATSSVAPSSTRVNLSQWLNNLFETGWQTVEALLNPQETELAFGFRNADSSVATSVEQPNVRRAKLIDLGMQLADRLLVLIVELRPTSEYSTDILLQVHPTGSEIYLPPGLNLIVLDESGSTFLEASSRSADNYVQLLFDGQPGERFSVQVALASSSITEEFVI